MSGLACGCRVGVDAKYGEAWPVELVVRLEDTDDFLARCVRGGTGGNSVAATIVPGSSRSVSVLMSDGSWPQAETHEVDPEAVEISVPSY